jgi:hypothetical protein
MSELNQFVSTRRKFLFDLSAVSVAALASPARMLAEAAPSVRRRNCVRGLSCDSFSGQVNSTFRIHATPLMSIQVKLDEVRLTLDKPAKPGKRPRPDAGNEKFSLFFVGRRSELLKQGTYTFEHDTLGRFDLFMVPVFTRNPEKIDYQIVFNRPKNRAWTKG